MTDIGVPPPGYRLPQSAHIGRVRLQIGDLDQSVTYYETVLGFRTLQKFEGSATLAAANDNTVLIELCQRHGVARMPRRGLLGLYHFAVLLPNRASLGQFLLHLSAIGIQPGIADYLVSEALYLTDPDGLGVEVYADRPRESWTSAGGQLEMATKPLDTESLVESAGGERWTGAPAGTRIGHLHFHVGDLERAALFYHAAVGLDKTVWGYPGALFMAAGGYHHHVGVNTWAAGARLANDDDARLLDWELVLPDSPSAESAAKSIESAGFAVDRIDGCVTATDPWGIRVRLHVSSEPRE